jgi:mono/diheme cytochrome c family protein
MRHHIFAVLVSVAAASSSPKAVADDVAKGAELAHALCAQCHLNEGQGEKQGQMGIPGFVAVANRPGQTFDGIVSWLKSVPPMMPNHHLTQDEMFAVAAYIMALRKE